MEYRMKNKFGEYRWIRDFGRPFYDLDNIFLGYIGSCYDITEYKNKWEFYNKKPGFITSIRTGRGITGTTFIF
jgi:hypothetical protein